MPDPVILVINVGSTSTKLAVFKGEKQLFGAEPEFLQPLPYAEQLPHRERQVRDFLRSTGFAPFELDAVVSRGGVIRPLPAGIYRINHSMCRDLLAGRYGIHPSGLGPVIALALAEEAGIPALTVDPPSTDELSELARFSGLPGIERVSAFHALSQKAAARAAAAELGLCYSEANFIVAHLGGGITVGAHRRGRVVDCNHGISEGPFTPERAGGLPTLALLDLAQREGPDNLRRRMVGEGGLYAYLGTKDAREVEKRIESGDREAALVYEALAYQTAKEIGAMAAALAGRVDAVVLTGGLSRSRMLSGWLRERVSFLAPVLIVPENEMQALAAAALRCLAGQEEANGYE